MTNVRLDHLDDMGRDKDGDRRGPWPRPFPDRRTSSSRRKRSVPVFEAAAGAAGARLHAGRRADGRGDGPAGGPPCPSASSSRTAGLALAVLGVLGVDRATADAGPGRRRARPRRPPVWRTARSARPPRPRDLRQRSSPPTSPNRRPRRCADPRGPSCRVGRPLVGASQSCARTAATGRSSGSARPADGFFRRFRRRRPRRPSGPSGAAAHAPRRSAADRRSRPSSPRLRTRSPEALMDLVVALAARRARRRRPRQLRRAGRATRPLLGRDRRTPMIVETLLIGLVLALVWAELTDVSPGGIIVARLFRPLSRPAAARRGHPGRRPAAPGRSTRFLVPALILFGRRRFVLTVLVGAVLSQAWLLAAAAAVRRRRSSSGSSAGSCPASWPRAWPGRRPCRPWPRWPPCRP
ncbi:MAG: poly-gamma-glutamate biosynthesis protein PgsC/CapC [Marinilabiliales bacterium]|nr:poly-gamma-glutamate biosynthesis protein PgsC/CapC [Marinilabiliales bacterium]